MIPVVDELSAQRRRRRLLVGARARRLLRRQRHHRRRRRQRRRRRHGRPRRTPDRLPRVPNSASRSPSSPCCGHRLLMLRYVRYLCEPMPDSISHHCIREAQPSPPTTRRHRRPPPARQPTSRLPVVDRRPLRRDLRRARVHHRPVPRLPRRAQLAGVFPRSLDDTIEKRDRCRSDRSATT